jgi:hypothetical protein
VGWSVDLTTHCDPVHKVAHCNGVGSLSSDREDGDEDDLVEAEKRSGSCGCRDRGTDRRDTHDGIRESEYTHLHQQPRLRMEMPQAPVHGDLRPHRSKRTSSVEGLGQSQQPKPPKGRGASKRAVNSPFGPAFNHTAKLRFASTGAIMNVRYPTSANVSVCCEKSTDSVEPDGYFALVNMWNIWGFR